MRRNTRARIRKRHGGRRKGSVLARLFAFYLGLCILAAVGISLHRRTVDTAVTASAPAPDRSEETSDSLSKRVGKALGRFLDLVRPASAKLRPLPEDDERMRSFGERLFRAAMNAVGGLDPSDPRTMIRAELPALMGDERASQVLRSEAEPVMARAALGRDEPEVKQTVEAVEPWALVEAEEEEDKASEKVSTEPVKPETSVEVRKPATAVPAADLKPKTADIAVTPRKTAAKQTSSSVAKVAVFHTHSSEAYRASQGSDYLWGKTDGVVKVGATLAQELEKLGVGTVHSSKVHDYPDWTRSYSRAATTIRSILESSRDLKALLDIHRDAIPANRESLRCATVNGQKVARVLFVVTDDSSGLAHPNWRRNYAFALKVSAALDRVAPGVSRGVAIHKNGRFNQQLHDRAIIIEIGGTSNTLEEATRSAKLVAKAVAQAL